MAARLDLRLASAVLPAALIALLLHHPRAAADPPAALRDSGDCRIEASQNRILQTQSGKTFELRSFFEPGDRVAINRVDADDLRKLSAEVVRLQANPCYEVCVRPLATGAGLNQAAANCDLVYIVAHGSKEFPYISLGGRPGVQITAGPPALRASSIWIASCFAQNTVQNLNAKLGQRYRTMPANRFLADGTAGRNVMVRELTAELALLRAAQCELPQRVCILSAVQEVVQQ
jgi:hypothetical protein